MITFDVPLFQVLGVLASVILPAIVGLVTTRTTSPKVKAIALAALAVIINLVTELAAALQSGTEYNLGTALLLALATFVTAVGVHVGFLRPTGVTDAVQGSLVVDKGPDHRA